MKATLLSIPLEELQSYVVSTKHLIETELQNVLAKASATKLRPLLEYSLLSEGKRLRPILTVLSAESVGGEPRKIVRLALAFELLHTATLVHDDIIDCDTQRRGIETVCSKWNMSGAVLTGDALIALSINLAADYGPEVMKIVSNVGLELCDGEYIDVSLSLDKATEREYFTKIEKKSASLFRAVTYCGALVAGGTSSEVEALARFGENFGMAYQVNDDLTEVLSASQVSQDLLNGNVTLPFMYAFQHGDERLKDLLRLSFGSKHVTRDTVQAVRAKMDEVGAFKYCREKIDEYSQKCGESIEDVRESRYREFLKQLPSYLPKSS